jgi:hypothetical protein
MSRNVEKQGGVEPPHSKMHNRFLAIILFFFFVAGPSARIHSPRIVSPHNADAYSMKTFAQFPRWRDLKGDALAWEVYKY